MKKFFIFLICFDFIVLSSFAVIKLCQYRNYIYLLNDKKALDKQEEKIKELDKKIEEYNEQINSTNDLEVELWKKSLEEIQQHL